MSCTTTLNDSYGSAVTVTGAGFLLNDEMDDFATAPGKPNMYGLVQGEANAIAPGKRMLSAMTPSIVLDPSGQLYMVVGNPGRAAHHHHGLPRDLQRDRPPHAPSRGGDGAADAPPGAARQPPGRGRRLHADDAGQPSLARTWDLHPRHWGDVEAIIRTPAGWQGVSDPRRGRRGAGY